MSDDKSDMREDIIAASSGLPVKQVDTPEWEPKTPHVFVRKLSVNEVKESIELANDDDSDRMFLQKFCTLAISDESGRRIFEDADHEMLAHKQACVLQRICEASQEHNDMTKTEEDEDEAVGNLPATPEDSSTSPSPSTSDTITPT